MSQVVVTQDALSSKREKSRKQELAIEKNEQFSHWLLSDISSKKSPIMAVLGIAFLPVAVFWTFLLVGIGFAVALVSFLMSVMSRIWDKNDS